MAYPVATAPPRDSGSHSLPTAPTARKSPAVVPRLPSEIRRCPRRFPDTAAELLFSTLIVLAPSRPSRVGGVPTTPSPWPEGCAGPPRIASTESPRLPSSGVCPLRVGWHDGDLPRPRKRPPASAAAALGQARGQAAGGRPSCPKGWKASLVPSSNPATLLASEKTGLSEITGLLARRHLTIAIMHKPVQAPPHFPDLALLTEVKVIVPCSKRSRDAQEQTYRVRDAQVSDQEQIPSEEYTHFPETHCLTSSHRTLSWPAARLYSRCSKQNSSDWIIQRKKIGCRSLKQKRRF